jgi:pilus assembly protein FimV
MARKFAAVVFSLGCIQAGSAFALGLGDLQLDSFLNEPLNARVQLLNTDNLNEEQIRIRLATREDFERMGVDRAYFLTQIQFDVDMDDQGRAVITITSEDPVLEPYLDFIVEARWPTGRLLREYTVLVDPPLFDSTTPVVSASARVAEVEGIPDPRTAEKKSQAASSSSGTRVNVERKSQLGPGDMPQRDFNAGTSENPVSGQRYMIHRDDTLWEIASAAKPSGTTVHQTMLDIQRLNPKAFIDGNINRIKAGYIIYLPQEGDISSSDLAAALAEVRQQNDDWEAGRASKPIASGPALRISADTTSEEEGAGDTSGASNPAGSAAMEEMDKAALDQAEQSGQLAAMQQQVDTLQRIVSLKDDQIAALQAALAEAGGDAGIVDEPGTSSDGMLTDLDALEAANDELPAPESAEPATGADTAAIVADEPAMSAEPEATEPAPQPAPAAPAPTSAPSEGGMMSYLFYGLGALVLAVLAFLFVRRRGEEEDAPIAAAPSAADDQAFASVELKEQPLEEPEEPAIEEQPIEEPEQPAEELQGGGDRGYGERKHDEYASDVETGDALAEADIYIAYGRYPQAIDLLRGAITSEPSNPSYRLKMLELYLQTGDRSAAENEMRELEAIGDAAAIERGRSLLAGAGDADPSGVDLTEPPAGLAEELGGSLESDFAGLEIEDAPEAVDEVADDLDLSSDFAGSLDDAVDEDLVIAAEANGMSTKLDLARAYLDMGDEDGARQILEEVVSEGSEEQKAEAGELLERIG